MVSENEKQELELLDGFRRLDPADKKSVLAAVTMAIAAESAVRRQLQGFPACVNCGQATEARQVVNG